MVGIDSEIIKDLKEEIRLKIKAAKIIADYNAHVKRTIIEEDHLLKTRRRMQTVMTRAAGMGGVLGGAMNMLQGIGGLKKGNQERYNQLKQKETKEVLSPNEAKERDMLGQNKGSNNFFDKLDAMMEKSFGGDSKWNKMFGGQGKMAAAGLGAGAVAGGIGLGKMIIDSSPAFQSLLKLLNFGIMLILRPIGDFFALLFRPILIMLLRKLIIPFYQTVYPWFLKNLNLVNDVAGALEDAVTTGSANSLIQTPIEVGAALSGDSALKDALIKLKEELAKISTSLGDNIIKAIAPFIPKILTSVADTGKITTTKDLDKNKTKTNDVEEKKKTDEANKKKKQTTNDVEEKKKTDEANKKKTDEASRNNKKNNTNNLDKDGKKPNELKKIDTSKSTKLGSKEGTKAGSILDNITKTADDVIRGTAKGVKVMTTTTADFLTAGLASKAVNVVTGAIEPILTPLKNVSGKVLTATAEKAAVVTSSKIVSRVVPVVGQALSLIDASGSVMKEFAPEAYEGVRQGALGIGAMFGDDKGTYTEGFLDFMGYGKESTAEQLAGIAGGVSDWATGHSPRSEKEGAFGMGNFFGMAEGGMIKEPIKGIGKSGQKYMFGETGMEAVMPMRKIAAIGGMVAKANVSKESRSESPITINITVNGSIHSDRDMLNFQRTIMKAIETSSTRKSKI